LNAIATEYLEKWNTNKAILIDAGELGQKIFNASHSGTSVQKIKNKLLENDLILIDGIEYFCKKPILINIVDEIIRVSKSNKKNIVFSSKTPLNEIKKKDRTLYSLINGEMNCIISLTHLNDKKRFIVNVIKQQNFDIQLTDDALQYLANQNFDGNLNSLNILIQRVGVFPKQNNNTLLGKQDVENLTEVVKNDKYSCTATIETICKYYDMQYHDVTSKSRIKDIVFVRSICMYILYEKFNLSLKKIGNFFNNRSHSTIKHSISKVKTLKKKDNKVSLKLKELENLF
jgi:chromosomal replication initiator protein